MLLILSRVFSSPRKGDEDFALQFQKVVLVYVRRTAEVPAGQHVGEPVGQVTVVFGDESRAEHTVGCHLEPCTGRLAENPDGVANRRRRVSLVGKAQDFLSGGVESVILVQDNGRAGR